MVWFVLWFGLACGNEDVESCNKSCDNERHCNAITFREVPEELIIFELWPSSSAEGEEPTPEQYEVCKGRSDADKRSKWQGCIEDCKTRYSTWFDKLVD